MPFTDIKRGVLSLCFIFYSFNDTTSNIDARPRAQNGSVTSEL